MEPEMRELQQKFDEWNPECEALEVLMERQQVDMLRVPVLVERARDFIEEGNSHVIFVPYRATLEALVDRLGVPCSVIWGGQSAKERQENVDAFQFDRNRVCVIVNRAGAETISLHDLNGNYPRTADIVPPYEAWLLKQIVGRVHRAGGKSKSVQYIVCAGGTYEETVYKNLMEKARNLDALNDYDLNPLNYKLPA
jgi:superfamily II DNA or RNA helicase